MNDNILLKIGAGSINIYAMNENIILLECTKCKELKPLDEFCRNKRRPDRHSRNGQCKNCSRKYCEANRDTLNQKSREHYNTNKTKMNQRCKKYYQANTDKIKKKSKDYYQANKEYIQKCSKEYRADNRDKIRRKRKEKYEIDRDKILEGFRKWYQANKDLVKQRHKKYYDDNCEVIRDKNNRRHRKKFQEDLFYRLNRKIRYGLYRIIVKLSTPNKTKTSIEYVGCTVDELKEHLESQFEPGMTWDNHSVDGWHIDHIIPIDWWVKNEPDKALERANHYTNLQPLWARDNIIKSNKLM